MSMLFLCFLSVHMLIASVNSSRTMTFGSVVVSKLADDFPKFEPLRYNQHQTTENAKRKQPQLLPTLTNIAQSKRQPLHSRNHSNNRKYGEHL